MLNSTHLRVRKCSEGTVYSTVCHIQHASLSVGQSAVVCDVNDLHHGWLEILH